MLSRFTLLRSRFTRGGVLSGGALLFASMTIVNAGNYLFNLLLGRWLGPAAFADLSLIVTLLLLVSFMTTSLAQTTAKFSAIYTADNDLGRLAALRSWVGRNAWIFGGVLLVLLVVGSPLWMSFFHTASVWPFVILGIGMPVYFAQGVDRGILQGQTRFGALALSYQAEMWVRLIAALGFVALGWSVIGATAGLTLSLFATWLVARSAAWNLPAAGDLGPSQRRTVRTFAGPVVLALVGQVLINNSDILIVKHFFDPVPAGQYAALALIGRIVFFATWSVVTAMFPIVAQREQRGEPHRHLLWLSLGLVAFVSTGIVGATLLTPELIVRLLFGAAYLQIAPLLWLYALTTALYALGNVVIHYRLSVGNGGGSLLSLGAGLAQVGGLWLVHSTLREVVLVQLGIMGALLAMLLAWDLWLSYRVKNVAGAKGTS